MDTGEPRLPEGYAPLMRVQKIIVGALAGGVVVFLAIAIGLRASGREFGGATGATLSYASAALLVCAVLARSVLLAGLTAQGRRHIATGKWRDGSGVTAAPAWQDLIEKEGDAGRLLALYQSQAVIGAAVLEAAGLFGCVAHLLEGSWVGPGVAVVAVGLILALQFPSREAAAAWLADQQRRLREEGAA